VFDHGPPPTKVFYHAGKWWERMHRWRHVLACMPDAFGVVSPATLGGAFWSALSCTVCLSGLMALLLLLGLSWRPPLLDAPRAQGYHSTAGGVGCPGKQGTTQDPPAVSNLPDIHKHTSRPLPVQSRSRSSRMQCPVSQVCTALLSLLCAAVVSTSVPHGVQRCKPCGESSFVCVWLQCRYFYLCVP
jgi:hypothetical protein